MLFCLLVASPEDIGCAEYVVADYLVRVASQDDALS